MGLFSMFKGKQELSDKELFNELNLMGIIQCHMKTNIGSRELYLENIATLFPNKYSPNYFCVAIDPETREVFAIQKNTNGSHEYLNIPEAVFGEPMQVSLFDIITTPKVGIVKSKFIKPYDI